MSHNQEEDLFARLEIEIAKYMDISTIFKRLKGQGYLVTIHTMFQTIFQTEYEYTIAVYKNKKNIDLKSIKFIFYNSLQELIKMASLEPINFNITEHYKMNSHIFKQNIALITNLVIDDLWHEILNRSNSEKSNQSLECIQELSNEQGQFDTKLSPINQKYVELENSAEDQPENVVEQIQSVSNLKKGSGQDYRNQLELINQIRKQKQSQGDNTLYQQTYNDNYNNNKNSINNKNSHNNNINNNNNNNNNNNTINESIQQSKKSSAISLQQKQNTIRYNNQQQQPKSINGKQSSGSQSQNIIAPSQQNYKTIQYITQIVKVGQNQAKQTDIDVNVFIKNFGQSAIFQKNFKHIPTKDSQYDSHINALGQQDTFQQILLKRNRQKSIGKIEKVK